MGWIGSAHVGDHVAWRAGPTADHSIARRFPLRALAGARPRIDDSWSSNVSAGRGTCASSTSGTAETLSDMACAAVGTPSPGPGSWNGSRRPRRSPGYSITWNGLPEKSDGSGNDT